MIAILGILQLVTYSQRVSKSVSLNIEVDQIVTTMNQILSDQKSCDVVFVPQAGADIPISTTPVPMNMYLPQGDGAGGVVAGPLYLSHGTNIKAGLQVAQFTLNVVAGAVPSSVTQEKAGAAAAVMDRYPAEIILTINRTVGGGSVGAKVLKRRFDLAILLEDAGGANPGALRGCSGSYTASNRMCEDMGGTFMPAGAGVESKCVFNEICYVSSCPGPNFGNVVCDAPTDIGCP